MDPAPPRLTALVLADPPELWRSLGFAVGEDGRCVVGGIALHLVGPDGGRSGIVGWSFDRDVAFTAPPATVDPVPHDGPVHPNGVVAVDHVVLADGDPERTGAELERSGIAVRRTWERPVGDVTVHYRFAVVGPTVLECVSGLGAATGLWGVTLVAADVEAAAIAVGAPAERIRPAVQPGRRILPLDTRAAGGSVRLALMDPRPTGPDRESEIS